MRTNNLMADVSYAESTTLSLLYNSYCMNVCGSQLWRLNNKFVEGFYVAWRKTIRRIWRLDNNNNNNISLLLTHGPYTYKKNVNIYKNSNKKNNNVISQSKIVLINITLISTIAECESEYKQ